MANINTSVPADGVPASKPDLRNNLTAIKSAVEVGQSSSSSTNITVNANNFSVGTNSEREFISIRCTAASAITVSLADDVPAGKAVELVRYGNGNVTAQATGGASLNKPTSVSATTAELYEAMVFVVDTNTGGSSAAWRLQARP